ncbi:heavy-metal-associated domain-containing protein [Angustibacter peucedani]
MSHDTTSTFTGTATFQVEGMTCEHCRTAVTAEVTAVSGVESVAVDLPTGTVTVSTSAPVDRSAVAAAVDEAGYTLRP